MQPDEIKQRNIDEGRSYRNIIEFTEHGYRFKPDVDVQVKPQLFTTSMPEGSRKLSDVYQELAIPSAKAHYEGFKHFIKFMEDGLEGVAEDKKAALVNHFIGGKKIDLSRDKEVYQLTPEGVELFQAYFTQSPTNQYKVRGRMLREQELEHQSALAKGHYITDPLQKVLDDFKLIPRMRAGEVRVDDVGAGRGRSYVSISQDVEEYKRARIMDEALFIATERALDNVDGRYYLQAPVIKVEHQLAHRHDLERPQLRFTGIRKSLRLIVSQISPSADEQTLEARQALLSMATNKKMDAYEGVSYPIKREAQQTINDFYVGARREGDNSYVQVFTPKGLSDYEEMGRSKGSQPKALEQPASQTSAQGDVDTLGKGAGKSK